MRSFGGVGDMRVLLARFLCEESGATEIGYALIVAGMAVAIITVLSGLGSKLSMALTTVRAALE
jgi:pilus assembly protein Flp/PilA